MGRAIVSFLMGDFKQYIEYNIMAIPVALVFLCELFNVHFGKYRMILHICSSIILVINMIYYLIRINVIF